MQFPTVDALTIYTNRNISASELAHSAGTVEYTDCTSAER